MATIKTKFTLKDKVSPSLKNITGNLEKTTKGFESMAGKIVTINSLLQLFNTVSNYTQKFNSVMDERIDLYNFQVEQETKLGAIMRQRMNATKEEIDEIKALASAEQEVGIYGDEMVLVGAQELATFVSNKEALKKFIPALNDLVADQKGFNATGADFVTIADMMGKSISGSTTSLSKYGYTFSEAEKKILETGTELERVQALADIITSNISKMNKVLAKTPQGRIQQLRGAYGDLLEEQGKALVKFKVFTVALKTEFAKRINKPLVRFFNKLSNNIEELTIKLAKFTKGAIIGLGVVAAAWALLHWKITLCILAVALFAGVEVKSANLTVESNDIMEASFTSLAKTIAGIGGFFQGLFAIVYNLAITIENFCVSFVSDIFLLFRHPFIAIKNFIIDVISLVLEATATLSGLIDIFLKNDKKIGPKLLGANKKLRSHRGERKKKFNPTEDLLLGMDYFFENFVRDDLVDVKGIYGYDEKAKKLSYTLTNTFKDALKDVEGLMEELNGKFKNSGDGSLLTQDNSKLDLTEGWNELLSQASTSRYNNTVTKSVPILNIGTINVNNGTDYQTFINELHKKFSESVESNLSR